MKKITSLLLILTLLYSLSLPTLAAEDPAFYIELVGTIDTDAKFNGQNTVAVSWQLKANKPNMTLNNTQGIRIAYDSAVLQLIRWDASSSISEPLPGEDFAQSPGAGNVGVLGSSITVFTAKSTDSNTGYLSASVGSADDLYACVQNTVIILGEFRFAFKPGKDISDLSEGKSVRVMNTNELFAFSQSYSILINDDQDTSYTYGNHVNGVAQPGKDTLDAPAVIIPALFDPNALTFAVGTVTAEAGGTVEVPITITNNPGISVITDVRIDLGAGLTLYYPQGEENYAAGFATWPYIAGNRFQGEGEGMIPIMGRPTNLNISDTHIVFNFQDTVEPFNSTENGMLITLRLKVDENVDRGAELPITITVAKVGNLSQATIPFNLVNGKVTIPNVLYGDVNGDNRVDGFDVQALVLWINAGKPSGVIDEVAARISSAYDRPDGFDIQALVLWINSGGNPLVGHPGPYALTGQSSSSAVSSFSIAAASAEADLTIEVDSKTASPGDYNVEVPILITYNPGVSVISDLRIELGAGLSLYFPFGAENYAAAYTTWPYIAGNRIQGEGEGMIPTMGRPTNLNIGDSYIILNFQDTTEPFNCIETGMLVTLKLTVDATASGNIPITVSGGMYDSIPNQGARTPVLVSGYVNVITSAILDGAVAITGATKYNETLTADTTGLTTDPAGADIGALSYQWKRAGVNIVGANSATYTPIEDDIGKTITVTVTAQNCEGEVTSVPVGPIAKADGPAAPTAPKVASKSATSVTLDIIPGAEYKLGTTGLWQTSPVFDGLDPYNEYVFFARIAETATHEASAVSVASAVIITESQTLSAGSAIVCVGNTIKIPVTASGSPLLASLRFVVAYDAAALKLADVTLPNGSGFSVLVVPGPGKETISLVPNGTNSVDPNGVMLTIIFEINENAALGDYLISLQNINAVDETDSQIQFSAQDGSVKIIQYGDFTGNWNVDGNDILWINRFIQSSFILSEMIKTWSTGITTFCEPAADFTNNGYVDGTDILWIHRYSAVNKDPWEMVRIWPTAIDFSHIGVENNTVSSTASMQSAMSDENFVYMVSDETDVPIGETFNLTVGAELSPGIELSTLWVTLDYDQSAIRLVTSGISYPSNLTSASDGPFYFALSPKDFNAQGSGDVMILTFEVLDDSKEAEIRLAVNRASSPDDIGVTLIRPDTVVINHTTTCTVTSIKIEASAQATLLRASKYTFTVTLNPGATSEGIVWSITPSGFATVNPTTGEVITQNKTGTVLLTATDTASGLSNSVVLRIM
ncbi:MAG: cohesin domain-containing protein [Oscillospiraceae bacterium]|nr:cohesin domain-containing protein [Oscillospiraceae bacterium]